VLRRIDLTRVLRLQRLAWLNASLQLPTATSGRSDAACAAAEGTSSTSPGPGRVAAGSGRRRAVGRGRRPRAGALRGVQCGHPDAVPRRRHRRGVYWDSVFSENPPICALPRSPPTRCGSCRSSRGRSTPSPAPPGAIADRRAELTANLSLEQEVDAIETINQLVRGGYLANAGYREVGIERIELDRGLDPASAAARSPSFLAGLVADGEKAGAAFLEERRRR